MELQIRCKICGKELGVDGVHIGDVGTIPYIGVGTCDHTSVGEQVTRIGASIESLNDVINRLKEEESRESSPLDASTKAVVQSMVEDMDEFHTWLRMNDEMLVFVDKGVKKRVLLRLDKLTDKYRTDDMVGD